MILEGFYRTTAHDSKTTSSCQHHAKFGKYDLKINEILNLQFGGGITEKREGMLPIGPAGFLFAGIF